jgi:RimJ/RimL family protein N-acetyltransferase
MTLILAQACDEDLITRMWRAPSTVNWIEPPERGEISTAIDAGLGFLWQKDGAAIGCAVVMTWVPRVFGISAIVTTQPGQGAPFLRALLAHLFGPLNGHRLGLDVTADNARAIALYEACGFAHEGRVRECWQRPDGVWVDCLLMGILAKEWQG